MKNSDRNTIIATVVKDMKPAEPPKVTIEQRVREWLPQLKKLRAEGYSPAQLVTVLAAPAIGIQTSEKLVRRLLKNASTKATVSSSAKPAA